MFKRERNRFLLNNLSGPLSKKIIYLLFFGCTTWYVGFSQQGIEPVPPAVEAQNLSHWTTLTLSFSFLFPNPRDGEVQAHTGCRSKSIAFVLHTWCKSGSSEEAALRPCSLFFHKSAQSSRHLLHVCPHIRAEIWGEPCLSPNSRKAPTNLLPHWSASLMRTLCDFWMVTEGLAALSNPWLQK